MSKILEIEVDNEKYHLLFGMVCTQIVSERSIKVAENKQKISDMKYLSFVVYGGMCNYAEKKDLPYPKYEDCYDLTNTICENDLETEDKLQTLIYSQWMDSKPSAKLLSLLPKGDGNKKKVENQRTGTK